MVVEFAAEEVLLECCCFSQSRQLWNHQCAQKAVNDVLTDFNFRPRNYHLEAASDTDGK